MPQAQQFIDSSSLLLLEDGETSAEWTGTADVSNITTSTVHKTGSNSLSFDKSGTTLTTGQVSKSLRSKNARLFSRGTLSFSINLSSLVNLNSVSIHVGESATNHNVYTQSELKTGWNEVVFNVDQPTSITGTGTDWDSIDYIAVVVTFAGAGDTLTDILVDNIRLEDTSDMASLTTGIAREPYYAVSAALTGNATLDVMANLGYEGIAGSLQNTHGTEAFAFNINGGDNITINASQTFSFQNMRVRQINLIHTNDSSYQLFIH